MAYVIAMLFQRRLSLPSFALLSASRHAMLPPFRERFRAFAVRAMRAHTPPALRLMPPRLRQII